MAEEKRGEKKILPPHTIHTKPSINLTPVTAGAIQKKIPYHIAEHPSSWLLSAEPNKRPTEQNAAARYCHEK